MEIGQRLSKENKLDRINGTQTQLLCFKLNPEVIDKTPGKRLYLPDIPVLIIPNIKSYFNLHTDPSFHLKTTILSNSDKSFNLFIAPNRLILIHY